MTIHNFNTITTDQTLATVKHHHLLNLLHRSGILPLELYGNKKEHTHVKVVLRWIIQHLKQKFY